MPNQPLNHTHYAIATGCCFIVFCIAVLFTFGIAELQFGSQVNPASVDAIDGGSKVSVSLRGGIKEILADTGVRGKASLVITLLFTLSVALFPVAVSMLALVFSSVLVVAVHFSVPGNGSDPSLFAVFATLVSVFVCYLIFSVLQQLAHRRRVGRFFKNYVPSNLTDYYLQNPEGMEAVSESRELTILFCDIKRFTSISETLEPDRLRDWLNAYFDIVSQIIHQHGGTVDKYMGDSVMAFWGAPWASDTHATDALYASRKIQQEVAVLSQQMQTIGLPAITIGIGISTGFANVGHMGSKHHMTYTAVGDPVNTANRLQRCTGYYDLALVVSEATVEKVPKYLFRELDTVHVKGRQRFVRLFEPVCPIEDASPQLLKRLQLHRKAMQFYRRGMWHEAEALFGKLGRDDLVEREFYQKYVDRIQKIKSTRPKDERAHIVDLTRQIG